MAYDGSNVWIDGDRLYFDNGGTEYYVTGVDHGASPYEAGSFWVEDIYFAYVDAAGHLRKLLLEDMGRSQAAPFEFAIDPQGYLWYAHLDAAHSDAGTDTRKYMIAHTDGGYQDHSDHGDAPAETVVLHGDVTVHSDYSDTEHGDVSNHDDIPHDDSPHQDHGDYSDNAHFDAHSDHDDAPHFDQGYNDHGDYSDYSDNAHGDSSPPHQDHSDHDDHADNTHDDLAHDDHNDHSDNPHFDHNDYSDHLYEDVAHDDYFYHADHADYQHFDTTTQYVDYTNEETHSHGDHSDHSDASHGDAPEQV